MVFSATAPSGEKVEGTVTVDGDEAVVTFTNDAWSVYSEVREYRYRKTSDTPNLYEPGS